MSSRRREKRWTMLEGPWRSVLALLLILVPSVLRVTAIAGRIDCRICLAILTAGMLLALLDG